MRILEQNQHRDVRQLVTRKQYAALHKVHPDTVNRWVRGGFIPIYYCGHVSRAKHSRYWLSPLDVPLFGSVDMRKGNKVKDITPIRIEVRSDSEFKTDGAARDDVFWKKTD